MKTNKFRSELSLCAILYAPAVSFARKVAIASADKMIWFTDLAACGGPGSHHAICGTADRRRRVRKHSPAFGYGRGAFELLFKGPERAAPRIPSLGKLTKNPPPLCASKRRFRSSPTRDGPWASRGPFRRVRSLLPRTLRPHLPGLIRPIRCRRFRFW